MKRLLISIALVLGAVCGAKAQFYFAGDDPGYLKWNYIKTPNYKIIYPRGLDSLARVYAKALETNRPKVALSSGYLPGEKYWCTTPVVLHPRTGYANGSVAWAPMRMDLYTLPEAYNPETLPWTQELSIHENRHVAQLQFANDGILKPFTWLFGEASTGLFAGMFPSYWMLEGDAVAAETGLSKFGRGRSSDFMAYYMTAFDKGDMRNWEKWRWGSWRRYAPNHYALGYMTVAGGRFLYGDPLLTSDYLKTASHKPLKPSKLRGWFSKRSGKDFDASFLDVMTSFKSIWNADAAARGPFDELPLTAPAPKWYTTYSSLTFDADGNLYAIKSSYVEAASLIKVLPDGKELKIKAFASGISPLVCDGKRLLWTETIPDTRWSLAADSRLRVLEDGKTRALTKGRRLFNPAIGPEGIISVTEYPFEGGSAIVLLDGEGRQLNRIPAPDGVQIVESAWIGDKLFITFINDNGAGLAQLHSDGQIVPMLINGPDKINHLKAFGDRLYFISDRNGIGEVYSFSPESRSLLRITNTKYGVTDYAINDETLYFAARQYEGDLLYRAKVNELSPKEADPFSYYSYAVADTLSAQERRLADAAGIDLQGQWDGEISAPKRYSKILNAIRIHSWIPLGIDYDSVSSISSDDSYENISLGATVLFQNTLGTLSGFASYKHRIEEGTASQRQNSFHLNLTYTGLYPVIEGNLNIGDRNSVQYKRVKYTGGGLSMERLMGIYLDQPLVDAEVKAYIPFNFSDGGWQRGLIPQLRYLATNDRYNRSAAVMELQSNTGDFADPAQFGGVEPGDNLIMQSLYASVRGYVMRPKAHSQVYPSLGFGAEFGYHWRLGMTDLYSPQFYGYLYGYLPGLAPEQGLKLSALVQKQFDALHYENVVKVRPRGFAGSDLNRFLAAYAPFQFKVSADYAIPFWLGDISALSPLVYIKNFVFTPHFDYLGFKYGGGVSGRGSLYSAGADLTVNTANLLWFPFDCEIGLSYNYNGGSSFGRISAAGFSLDRNSVSFIFRTSL
ncbi:MAG: hypothetical protein IJ151_06055 [Bacteroidales bacterium]|nr:hypothetical protein [Bacteroidales bacterium]